MKTENIIPDLIIEQLLLDELPGGYSEDRKHTLLKDPYVVKRMQELKKSNNEILESYPVHKITENINRLLDNEEANIINLEKPYTKKKNLRSVFYTLSAAAVLIVALTFVFTRGSFVTFVTEEGPEIINIKGTTELSIYKKINNETEKLSNNSVVHENDRLQLRYKAIEKEYGMIFSLDGNGYITIHYPENFLSNNSAILDNSGKEVYIPHSYLLDDAPEFERFFFVTSDNEFSEGLIRESAIELFNRPDKGINNDLDLPEGFEQDSILLKKEL